MGKCCLACCAGVNIALVSGLGWLPGNFQKKNLSFCWLFFLFVHLFWFLRLQEGFYVYCEIIFNVPLSPALLKRRLVLEHTIKLLLGSAPTWMHFCGNVGETDHEIACMC